VTAATVAVLSRRAETKNINVDFPGATGGGTTLTTSRHFNTSDELIADVANARVWAGLHYRFSTTAGVELGNRREVGISTTSARTKERQITPPPGTRTVSRQSVSRLLPHARRRDAGLTLIRRRRCAKPCAAGRRPGRLDLRSRGGAVVTGLRAGASEMCAISRTARSNTASFAFDGFVEPLILRTYCSAAA
jgi:hypothetical protein